MQHQRRHPTSTVSIQEEWFHSFHQLKNPSMQFVRRPIRVFAMASKQMAGHSHVLVSRHQQAMHEWRSFPCCRAVPCGSQGGASPGAASWRPRRLATKLSSSWLAPAPVPNRAGTGLAWAAKAWPKLISPSWQPHKLMLLLAACQQPGGTVAFAPALFCRELDGTMAFVHLSRAGSAQPRRQQA